MCVVGFFFNDTATTEIYTYLHTLALHDALPISCPTASATMTWMRSRRPPSTAPALRVCRTGSCSSTCAKTDWSRYWMKPSLSAANYRSEEHTSELQSLMRISYAVFCLQKHKNSYKQAHKDNTQMTTIKNL